MHDPVSPLLTPAHPLSSFLTPSHPFSPLLTPSHPGSPLLTPAHPFSPLLTPFRRCDGCRRQLLLDELCYSDDGRNVDYCARCHVALPAAQRLALKEMLVYQRCGVAAPPGKELL